MIEHIVLFRFKPDFDAASPKIIQAHEAMKALPSKVSDIRHWRCGFNVLPDAEAWDYALCASFDDKQALFAYFDHPAHLEVLNLWSDVAELRFVDLED